ncbi:MAG: rod-binding protein [Chthonomonadales bacterium]
MNTATSSTVQRTAESQDLQIRQQKLRKATRQMEGYFVGMLLKQMHEADQKEGLFGKDSASDTYREMFYDAVGEAVGSRGAFGIADMLYKELAPRLKLEAAADQTGEGHGGTKP